MVLGYKHPLEEVKSNEAALVRVYITFQAGQAPTPFGLAHGEA